MFIDRDLSTILSKMTGWFPLVSLTGPRQSGKSTLLQKLFPGYTYLSLEDETTRSLAKDDPRGFLEDRPPHLILDEIQYVPDLFPALQVISDQRGETGQYILSGSQNFLLLDQIKQSLAGRVGLLRLLPLSWTELTAAHPTPVDHFLFRGGYPRLWDEDIPEDVFFSSYLSTYLDRDAASTLGIRDLTAFRLFIRLCAQSAGQPINTAKLASQAGINYRTAQSWLSALEASYILFRLPPYFSNHLKELTKTPKLYFWDTGLLSYLLSLTSQEELLTSPQLGAVFENLIVAETAKRILNQGHEPRLFFYRDKAGTEVDLVNQRSASSMDLIEIKSSRSFRGDQARHLVDVGKTLGVPPSNRFMVYRGPESAHLPEFSLLPVDRYLTDTDHPAL